MDVEEETPTPQEEEFEETGEKIQTTAFGEQNAEMEGEEKEDGEQLMNTHHSFGDIIHQQTASQEIGQSAS